MKRISIKSTSLAVAFSVLLAGTAGCSSETKNSASNENSNTTSVAQENKNDAVVELKVSVFDRNTQGYAADNNMQTKWIQKEFGDPNNIKLTFVPIPRFQEAEKLSMLMATNEAPDICVTYNGSAVVNYANNDGIIDLGDLLDKNAPNLKKFLGEELLSYGKVNDKQYAIPAKRVVSAAVATFIRKDWLDKLGMKEPETTEEFYDTLKAFKEKDPGKLGDKVIPFSFSIDPDNLFFSTSILLDSFKQKISDEDAACLPNWTTPGFKDGMKFLNKLYNEKLINTGFAADKDEAKTEIDITEGKVGAFIHTYDYPFRPNGMASKLKSKVPEANIVAVDPFTNYEGKHTKMKYNPNGLYIIVPKTSQRAVEAMKYLEWMSDPKVLLYLQNGEKGVHYTDEVNGIPANFVAPDKIPDDKKTNFIDLSIIVNGKEFGSEERNVEAGSYSYPGFEEQYKKAYKVAMTDAKFLTNVDGNTQAKAKYSKVLGEKEIKIFVKSITCKPAEFDKIYDSLVNDYLKAGGQEVIDESRKIYKANNRK